MREWVQSATATTTILFLKITATYFFRFLSEEVACLSYQHLVHAQLEEYRYL